MCAASAAHFLFVGFRMKKLVSLLLAVVMVITMTPINVLAESTAETTENIHIVSFDANGDDVTNMPEAQMVSDGETALAPSDPTKEGHIFIGWYLNAEETDFEKMFNFAETPIYDDTVLYAGWIDASNDADNDGLPDSIEEQLGTNTEIADTDADGLSDYIETVNLGTDPQKADTDDDGVSDWDEDCDGDGILNGDEISMGTNPANADSDFDGSDDNKEISIGSDPLNEDTDGDGAKDGTEIKHDSDPLVYNDSFTETNSSQPMSADFPVFAKVEAVVDASALDSVAINPITSVDNPLISENIPGYMSYAFELSALGKIDSAVLTMEYDETKWQTGETFQPKIYKFNETTQALDELSEQITEGNSVSVSVEDCGTYILLNSYEYGVIKGDYETVETDMAEHSGETLSSSESSDYSSYYAKYQEELKALVTNGDTTDDNDDGIYDKYNIYITLGLVPTTTGDIPFVGLEFGESDDYDGDGLKNGEEIKIVVNNGLPQIEITSYPMFPDSDFDGHLTHMCR